MKYDIRSLSRTALFAGADDNQIIDALECLKAKRSCCKKGGYVLRQGEYIESVCVLLSGRLHIKNGDYWGKGSILGAIEPGEIFAEAYAPSGSGALLNDVCAVEDSEILFLDMKKILSHKKCSCGICDIIKKNLICEISGKNRSLVAKLGYISKRTIREKLTAYLSDEAKKHSSSCFEIPYNRQQLADFLSVDRSAMSRELGKMRCEGLLDFDKNRFTLK